ncbi:MAG: SAM-dependent methyltransferase [Polaromonas sp.]|nr:SAM-dependent methyltransferase [Polaromonas sp.]
MTAGKGKLYLVPAPLDFGCDQLAPIQDVMPLQTLQIAARLGHFVCENAKSTRAYLKRVGEILPLSQPVQALQIAELPREVHKKGDHTGNFDARPMLVAAIDGQDMGLVSEAGMPAIADPGSSVVRAAHDLGIEVIALTGPMSLILALASSGLNGQNFAFVGYLPQDAGERSQRIKALEATALKTGQTQIFIETPYRNAALLQTLLQTLHGNSRLALSCGLTLDSAWNKSATADKWKKEKPRPPLGLPTVFCIGR